jgi:manganese/iron transport system permease protein
MLDWLIEPLGHVFMQRALLATVIVGTVSAVIGTFVVLRGMAFFGDALAHAILPGIAAGYLVSGTAREPLFWWALGAAILSSLGISTLKQNSQLREDTAIGIVFSGMFALGIAMLSSTGDYAEELTHLLFGNVLEISTGELWLIGGLGAIVLLLTIAFQKEFLLLSFDPVLARTIRIPDRQLDRLLFILIAVTVVVSLQTVGIALMVAMLVTPAASAFLISKRVPQMMLIAALLSILAGIIGLYLSYYMGIAAGAAIVLSSTAFFIIIWLLLKIRRS